jgi:hypothetical protein
MSRKYLTFHFHYSKDPFLSQAIVFSFSRLAILSLSLLLSGCAWWRPYHPTPLDALTEFPGYMNQDNLAFVELLQEENVAGGLVLLYRYPLYKPDTASNEHCVATTFVTEEQRNRWRSQSASKIGCGENYPYAEGFMATYTVGGNITDLTTAYGFSNYGSQTRISWSDGVIDLVPIQNGTFLKSRPQTLQVRSIELLDVDGEVLENKTWFP